MSERRIVPNITSTRFAESKTFYRDVLGFDIGMAATIVYPITLEPWGVRRFFVEDSNGVVINVLSHALRMTWDLRSITACPRRTRVGGPA